MFCVLCQASIVASQIKYLKMQNRFQMMTFLNFKIILQNQHIATSCVRVFPSKRLPRSVVAP